ncbi:MAG: acyltransferase family protein [Alphaproteobacteria bacterium]|nr:acyltransferase family protein [Alphaproteobacteria bacterium]
MNNAVERNWKIDYLKGIGIFFVLMGHIIPMGGITYDFIFNFHMELFFAIAGFLTFYSRNIDFKSFCLKKIKALIIPYYVLCCLTFFFLTAVNIFNLDYINWHKIFRIMIFDSNALQYFNLPLWFLPHLFYVYLLLYWIKKMPTVGQAAVVLLCMLIVLPYQHLVKPWEYTIGALPVSVIFAVLGYNVAKYQSLIQKYMVAEKYRVLLGWMLLLVGFVLSNFYYGQIIEIKNHVIILIAISVICGLTLIIQNRNAAIEYIGRKSLYIFGIHSLFIPYVIDWFNFCFPKANHAEGAYEFFISLVLLLLCCLIIWPYDQIKQKKTAAGAIIALGILSIVITPKYDITKEQAFSRRLPLQAKGFSGAEEWGCWTEGDVAEIKFSWRKMKNLRVNLKLHPFMPVEVKERNVDVFVNGKKAAHWHFEHGKPSPNTDLVLLKKDYNTKDYVITFEIQNPQSPNELGISDDTRKLGLGFETISIDEITEK